MSRIKKEKINIVNIYINMLSLSIVICMVLLLVNSMQINNAKISTIIIFVIILLITVAFFKHPPTTMELTINSKYIRTPHLVLNLNQVQDIYILSPVRKVFLSFIFGQNSYSSSLLLPGLLLTVNNESHVIDLNEYTHKLFKKGKNNLPSFDKSLSIIMFITLLIIPQIILYLSKTSEINPMFFLFIFVMALREVINYYSYFFLSEKLSSAELHNIGIDIEIPSNIEIRKGLTMGAKKPISILKGVSLNYVVKKYIILSRDLTNCNNNKYKKYILLHELGHMINNHGAFYLLFKVILILFILTIPILPNIEMPENLPDYTGVLILIIVFIIAILMLRNKKIQEEDADRFAVSVMGKENVIDMLLIDYKDSSKNLFNWINVLSGYPSTDSRIDKIKSMIQDDEKNK
jgi:Zn-dependent protease with chaperone function